MSGWLWCTHPLLFDAMHISAAKAVMDKAWTQLWDKRNLGSGICPRKKDVNREARTPGRTVPFGKVMLLCFIKNRQLIASPRFTRVEPCSERIASMMTRASSPSFPMNAPQRPTRQLPKMVASLTHMPDMEGQGADACGAYTSKFFQGDTTWVDMLPHPWFAAWHCQYKNPMVRLINTLFGRHEAGNDWAPHCKLALLKCGVRLVLGMGMLVYA